MSYTPKKLHEEGNRKRPLEESCLYSTPVKMIQPPDNSFYLPLESGQDGRSSKIQRSDPRDVDRKLSLLHNRSPSPGNYLDHRDVSRSELNILKDSSVKAETRETIRELYADTTIDRQGTRRDEKETRPDRGPYSCFKGDLKFGRDSCSAANSHSTLKEAKGHHRANCFESSSGLDPRRAAQHSLINVNEFANNCSTYEHNSLAAHMPLGAKRVNTEGEGKHRENNIVKDKKHKDFEERDKGRNGSGNTLQVRVVNEYKEPLEEREKLWRVTEINVPDQDKEHDNKKAPNQSERIPDRDIIASQQEDGDTQRNGGLFGNDVLQHSRMLRSLEAFHGPQLVSGALDHERSQVQTGVAAFVYKPGACAEVLLKSWREFKASQGVKNDESYPGGPTLEIQIPAEYVTITNSQVRTCQLWGEDIYTNDSDIVAVLMHTGYCRLTASFPAIHELRATIRVLPPQDWYVSKTKNKIRSRACGTCTGCSFRVVRCYIVKKDGGTIDLEPYLTGDFTLAPVSEEHAMTTRADASNSLRPKKFLPNVAIQYNLCNEPWLRYSMSVVADKGLKKSLYTAARLKMGEVLYLETVLHRYELCFIGERIVCDDTTSIFTQAQESKNKHLSHSSLVPNGEKSMKHATSVDVFRWSRCMKPLPQKLMRSIGIPLPTVHLKVIAENLEWEDVQWGQTGVWVAGKKYLVARAHFLSPA